MTRTINDLYFVLSVRDVALDPLALAKGVLLGVGATLAAALAPALEATGAPPRVVMSRGALESGAPAHGAARDLARRRAARGRRRRSWLCPAASREASRACSC